MRPAAILVGLFAVFAGVYGVLDPGLGPWEGGRQTGLLQGPFRLHQIGAAGGGGQRPGPCPDRGPAGFQLYFFVSAGRQLAHPFPFVGSGVPAAFSVAA